jgi:hypothetical protein
MRLHHAYALSIASLVVGCSARGGDGGSGARPTNVGDASTSVSPPSSSPAAPAARFEWPLSARPNATPLRRATDGYVADRAPDIAVHLPSTADGAVRIARDDAHAISVRPLEQGIVVGEPHEGLLVFANAQPSVDLVHVIEARGAEEYRVIRDRAALTVARWEITLDAGIVALRMREGLIEALGVDGNAYFRSPAPVVTDARGVSVRLRPNLTAVDARTYRMELELAASTASLALPMVLDPGWFTTATSLGVARRIQRQARVTTKAGNPGLLVTGGNVDNSASTALSSAEIYDSVAKTWTLAAPMSTTREWHAAATLADGRVIVSGGYGGTGGNALSSAEIYDPMTDRWTAVAPLPATRAEHAMGAGNGKAIAAFGYIDSSGGGVSGNWYIYDVAGNTWTTQTSTSDAKGDVEAVQLASGKTLFVGGSWYGGHSTGEVWDPVAGTLTETLHLATGRYGHALVSNPDGTAVVLGGNDGGGAALTSVEVFDPSSNSFHAGPNLTTGRFWPAAASACTCADGTPNCVVVAGGANSSTLIGTAELIDTRPSSVGATPFGLLVVPRAYGSAASFGGIPFMIAGESQLSSPISSTPSVESVGTAIANGTACKANGNCASGNCVDGYCCNAPCASSCQACDVAGKEGLCTVITGKPHNGRPACGTSGPECASTCDGVDTACKQGLTTTPCGTTSCSGSMLTGLGTCSGDTSNTCNVSATPMACPNHLVCGDPTSCLSKCTRDLDCVTGYVCNVAAGTCGTPGAPDAGTDASPATDATSDAPAPTDAGGEVLATLTDAAPPLPTIPKVGGSFQSCSKDSDCASGFCTDHVCCNSRCDQPCHSCALLQTAGTCTLEPAGVDFRNDCGATGTCTRTCDGAGQCIGAGAGTMCARNVCTGENTGTGPAYCSGAAPSACSNAEVTPFDCSPYACAPAFGACLTTCGTTADCAQGFDCDSSSHTCVAAAASGKGGGCAMGASRTGDSRAVLGVGLALGLLFARRGGRRRRAAA